jgi:hypothetical protein
MARQMPARARLLGVSIPLLALAGCSGNPGDNLSQGMSALGTSAGKAVNSVNNFVGSTLAGSKAGAATRHGVANAGLMINAAFGRISSKFTPHDRSAAAGAMNQALDSTAAQPVSWTNPETGNGGSFEAKPITYERRPVPAAPSSAQATVALVPPPANPEAVAAVWFTTSTVNLRAGPSGDAAVIGHVRAHRNFQVLGRVPGTPWLIVARNDKAVGYVSSAVARTAGEIETATQAPAAEAPGEPPTPAAATATAAGASETPATASPDQQAVASTAAAPAAPAKPVLVDPGAIDRSVETSGTVEQASGLVDRSAVDGATASQTGPVGDVTCRVTVSSVTLKGQSEPQVTEAKFCKAADGSWVPVDS